MRAHISLSHPCNHQPRVRGGEEGGDGTSSLPSTRAGKRSQVGEEEEEEGEEGLRLFSSLSLSIRALTVECSGGDRAVRVRWPVSLIRPAHSRSSAKPTALLRAR